MGLSNDSLLSVQKQIAGRGQMCLLFGLFRIGISKDRTPTSRLASVSTIGATVSTSSRH